MTATLDRNDSCDIAESCRICVTENYAWRTAKGGPMKFSVTFFFGNMFFCRGSVHGKPYEVRGTKVSILYSH